jgi:hypothetical protein
MNRRRLLSGSGAAITTLTFGGMAHKPASAQTAQTAQVAQPATTTSILNAPVVPATIPEGAIAESGQSVGQPVVANRESAFAPTPQFRTGVLVIVYNIPTERLPAPSRQTLIGGPAVSINTEKATSVYFEGSVGQAIRINTNRPWQLNDPLNRTIGNSGVIVLQDTGRYVLHLGPGLRAPATVEILTGNPSSLVIKGTVGELISLSTREVQPQLIRMKVRGGQRYRLTVPGSQQGATFCVQDWTLGTVQDLGCVNGVYSQGLSEERESKTFIPTSDQEVVLIGSFTVRADQELESAPAAISARITEAVNDVVVEAAAGPIFNTTAEASQSVVVPFWGTPAERGVISSPVESEAQVWGEPWIDRETPTVEGNASLKVFATPLVFDPARPPFVTWSGNLGDSAAARTKRYGVYRGEDAVITVPTTGEPVTVKNVPWFAAVASMTFESGDRYVLQVTGKNIRPLGLALRDPSGKFSSNRSPWQWTSSDTEQRAVTTVTADRGGRWALELRPRGDSVKDFSVSVLRVGAGGAYLGEVDVDDVLSIGEKTDVQLGPNEFARLRIKLTSSTPQIIQPEVLKYRNKTFQPTAVDMSIWDSRGRLVWSKNRDLEEEVLSGRLGKEPELSEKFATVASADEYTLIISPKGELAGRFRVSVTSTPVVSDVRLGDGPITRLPGGTRSGVLEVRAPTRYRVTGTNACIAITSVREWVASKQCIRSGRSMSLAPGVYRFTFQPSFDGRLNEAVPLNASFGIGAAGSGPDADPTENALLDDGGASLPAGVGEGVLSFAIPKAGTRVVIVDGNDRLVSGTLERPDGDRQPFSGAFVAPVAGTYQLRVGLSAQSARLILVRTAVAEVQRINLPLSKKPTVLALQLGQRLEATITVPKNRGIAVDKFSEPGAGLDFLYAANEKEERFFSIDGLPAGRYRLVFVGDGNSRITLRPYKNR